MDWYLGMRYNRDPISGVITLDQSKYAGDVLAKFKGLYKISAYYNTPMDENLKLPKWKEGYDDNLSAKSKAYIKSYPFRQVVGSLLYLAIWTRPNITYAVHLVAKHCVQPTLEAIHACNRILSYISLTRRLGLTFYPGNLKLTTFLDLISLREENLLVDLSNTSDSHPYTGKHSLQIQRSLFLLLRRSMWQLMLQVNRSLAPTIS